MVKEAASAGFYRSGFGTKHPRVQILTIEDLLDGARIDMPRSGSRETFRQAPAARRRSETGSLFDR